MLRRRFRPGRPFRPGRFLRRRYRRPRPAARAALFRLQQANAALGRAEFALAAAEFEALAAEAEGLGHPRALALHLQAGVAWCRAGEPALGLPHIQRGLTLLASRDPERARLIGERLAGDLAAWGLADESGAVRAELSRTSVAAPATDPSEPLPRLPAKCPQCGGNVHPTEVEWADRQTAICDYCGSPIPAAD